VVPAFVASLQVLIPFESDSRRVTVPDSLAGSVNFGGTLYAYRVAVFIQMSFGSAL
jgi:hypothetical protein